MAKELGKLIRQMRKASGMTQMKLAEKLGVTYQQVQKYEYGTSNLSLGRLAQLADVFGIRPVDFLGEAEQVEVKQDAPEYQSLNEDEVLLVLLYRRLGSRQLRDQFVQMVENIVNIRGLS
jgi:transcriptional regulator with XRE-family HTH domain